MRLMSGSIAQDLSRGDRDRLATFGIRIGKDQRRGRLPGQQAKRGEIGLELEITEAAVPASESVSLLGRHVHVGGEEVLARLGSVR